MISAYKKIDFENLELLESAKKLKKEGFIAGEADFEALEKKSILYHPGWIMRILLFIVGFVGLAGLVGLAVLVLQDFIDESVEAMFLITGFAGIIAFEAFVVKGLKHFKSGLSEVLLYSFIAIFTTGVAIALENSEVLAMLLFSVIFLVAAIRYLDKTLTLAATIAFVFFVVSAFLKLGGLAEKVIPFVIIIVFSALYFLSTRLEKRENLSLWLDQISVLQGLSLLLVYAGGNYFVVRELSQEMMGIYLEPGEDIPFAWLFYGLTVFIPLLYLYFGVKKRDRIMLWVGLIILGFSVFTFKFYYSSGHPEITVTLAGATLLAVAIFLLNKLKKPINGITRERLGVSDLDALTAEGVFISQTVGGITTGQQEGELFQGGDFGGGGASGNF